MKLKQVNLISKGVLKSPLLKEVKTVNSTTRQLIMAIGFCGLLVFLFTATPAYIVKPYKLNAAAAKYAVRDAKNKFKELQSDNFQLEKFKIDLMKEENFLTQRFNLLSSTLSNEREYSRLLLSIANLLPQDLWINRFIMDENEILISGSTLNSQLIAELMNKLEACKDFRNSRFISSEKQIIDSHTLYNFQITVEPGWSQKTAVSSMERIKVNYEK